MAAYEEVSTVFIGGIPPDATLREMDNLCRFMPGYVHSKVDSRKGTSLFVCFDSPDTATECIFRLDKQHFDRSNPGEALRVVMAKSNMRSGDHPAVVQRAPAHAPLPPPQALPQAPTGASRAGKRPRMYEDPYAIDTVAIVGAADRGFTEAAVELFFSQMPGFVVFKPNPRMRGGFAKFSAPACAVEAVQAAVPEGIPAEIAKSSMSSVGGGGGGAPPQPVLAAHHHPFANYPGGMAAPSAVDPWAVSQQEMAHAGLKRPRIPEDPNGVDTIAIIGAEDRGFPVVVVEAFFSAIPGFVAFKPNPRMGGGFAKFASSALAAEAVIVAISEGIPVEMAKSSMGATSGGQPPPQQYAAHSGYDQYAAPHTGMQVLVKRPRIPENPGSVDTVAMVGAMDRGFDEETLRAFMAGCPGFLVFKANPKMGGGFAKFDSPQTASEAVAVAMAEGVPAAIAKSSMSNLS